VRTYVINLARSLDRRAHITAELDQAGLEYQIVTAVDGRELDLDDSAIVDPSLPYMNPSMAVVDRGLAAGTAGAAMSHLSVYRRIIADGLDKALVLEDDVLVPGDLGSLADAVGHQLTGAEAALLSYDTPDPCKVSLDGSVRLRSGRVLGFPIDLRQPRSAGAYVITREACERMVKSLMPIRVQADTWWYFYDEGLLDRVRCIVPMPVAKSPEFTSTIGSYSLGSGLRGRLVGPIVRREIPLLHQAACYRRRRILRQWSRSELVDLPFAAGKPSRLD
jgi:glycosyl transferase family 25